MMVLFDSLSTHDGQDHAMWGLLPGQVRMQRRLAMLGPQQLALPQGTLRGHTFHHSICDSLLPPESRTCDPAGAVGEAVYRRQGLRASYFHAWFASSPAATAGLFHE